jgi:tyrosine-protein kinase Etk/Wzc
MPQYDFSITDFERIFRKRYKMLFLIAIIVVLFSIFFGRMKPSVYSASSTVKVERSNYSGLGMEMMMWGEYESLETQTRVINSFPVIVRAAKRMGLIPDSLVEDSLATNEKYAEIINGLRSKISTDVTANTNIIRIDATSGIAGETRDIANAIAFAYKDFAIRGKKRHADKVKEFIEKHMDISRQQLFESEQDVRSFEENQDMSSLNLSSQNTLEAAGAVRTDIENVENSLRIIQEQRQNLKERSATGDYVHLHSDTSGPEASGKGDSSRVSPGLVSDFADSDPGISQLNSRLIQLQFQLDDQLTYVRERHPLAIDIQKRIQETIAKMLIEYDNKQALLEKKREKLLAQKAEIDQKLKQLPAEQMDYARLVRKMKINEELFTSLQTRYQEALITEAGIVDDVTIMSLASVPLSPVNKNTPRIAMVGLFLGLLLGTLFAVVREMFDTSIGTIEDVEHTLKLTVLAVIPHIQIEEQQKKLQRDLNLTKRELTNLDFRARLVTQFDPKKPIAEAYRILRTNIEYLCMEKPIKTIHLTSATMQEGKSTTIANLAVAFAQQGKEILLLECNLRRPSLYRLFGVEKAPGIADILIDRVDWRKCVKTVTDLALGDFSIRGILNTPGLEHLNMITYGHTPPNPAEILSSPAMDKLLREVRDHFDVILVDAPPLLPVADSMVLSTKVDGVILVYKVGSAPRSSLALARERLGTVQANVLGIVLNDIRPETSGISYSRMYARYYGKEQKKKPRGRVFRSFSKKA